MDLRLGRKAPRVSGASKGIGRHVAEHLAAEGTGVAITAWAPGALQLPANEIRSAAGRRAHIPVDGAQRKAIVGW